MSQGCPKVSCLLMLKARAVLLLPIPHVSQAQRGISSSPGFTLATFITIIFIYIHPTPTTTSKTAARGVCSRESNSTMWFFICTTNAGCSSSSRCSPCCMWQCQENPNPGKALEHSWIWKMLDLSLFTHAGAAPRPHIAQLLWCWRSPEHRFPHQPADPVSTLLIAQMGQAAPVQVKQLLQFHMIQNRSPLNTKYPGLSEHHLVLSSATRVIY